MGPYEEPTRIDPLTHTHTPVGTWLEAEGADGAAAAAADGDGAADGAADGDGAAVLLPRRYVVGDPACSRGLLLLPDMFPADKWGQALQVGAGWGGSLGRF